MGTPKNLASHNPTFPLWKSAPPQIPDYAFQRIGLVTEIERCFTEPYSPVDTVLVTAPPGYGKSTLLAQWAATTNLPVMWLHLDAGDSDPATLLYGLIHALRTHAPRGHWETRELLAHTQRGALTPEDVHRATQVFSKDITAHLAKPAVLVLTGLDQLERQGEALALVESLLARPRDNLRLALEYRGVELLKLSTPYMQGRIKSFGLEQLQCTSDELAELFATRGIVADAERLDDLQSLCDGWVAGAVLATGAHLPKSMASRLSEEYNREAVFDYVAREVLARLPQPLYEFAVTVSVLDDMTASLCGGLLGVADARERLGALGRVTGMVSHFGARPDESIYRFQPLLRRVLRERLTALRGAEGLASLRVRAAELLEVVGDEHSDEQAAQLYALAGAADALVALIERRRAFLLRAGRGATLARWVALIDPDQRLRYPDLVILQAELHRVAGRTAQAEATIEEVYAQLRAADAPYPGAEARALMVRADIRYIRGRYAEARCDCEQAIALLPVDADDLHIQAHLILVACINMLDGPAAAKQCLDGAEARCRAFGDHSALGRFYYLRALLAHAEGAYLEAEAAQTAAILHAQEAGDKIRIVASRLYRGSIRQHLGQAREARDDLITAFDQSDEIGHSQLKAYVQVALADLEVLEGRFDAALEQIAGAQALERCLDDQHLRALIAVSSSRIHALTDHAETALAILEPALAALERKPEGQDWMLLQTALGFAAYRAGDYVRAVDALERVIPIASAQRALADCAQAYVILAAAWLAQGSGKAAEQSLTTALDLAEQIDGGATALLDARRLPALLPLIEATAHPVARDLVERLKSQESAAPDMSEDIDTSDLPIHVYTLGAFDVRIGEKSVTRWRRPQTQELLMYLLGCKRGARKSEILEEFWPKKDQKAAEDEFRKVRSALKQALGRPCLVERGGYWSLDVACRVDADEFMRLTEQGITLARQGEADEAATALHEALWLWKGSYLDNHWSNWAVLRRSDMQMRYLEALDLLAEHERLNLRYDQVERLSALLLKENELHEAAHRRLMICFAVRGDYSQALTQYRKCRDSLRHSLHVTPSAETIALSERIRALAKQRVIDPRQTFALL